MQAYFERLIDDLEIKYDVLVDIPENYFDPNDYELFRKVVLYGDEEIGNEVIRQYLRSLIPRPEDDYISVDLCSALSGSWHTWEDSEPQRRIVEWFLHAHAPK